MNKIKDNADLQSAKNNKADEFYTMLDDIEKEMNLYDFSGKIVYCPCDKAGQSNFYQFFKINFSRLNLKKLICFFYKPYRSFYTIYDGINEENTYITDEDAGDFRSVISKRLMTISDVIVTNPPFSLFREFISQVLSMNKEYIIMGNVNAVTYKDVFKNIVDGNMKLGQSIHSGDRKFYIPDDYPLDGTSCGVDENGLRYIRVKGVRWFTNMQSIKSFASLSKQTVLTMTFEGNEEHYQKYDFYDAINVNTMKEIPYDYYEEMGTPITVIDKMNEQGLIEFKNSKNETVLFELKGQLNGGRDLSNYDFAKPIIDGKCKFKRLVIKRV